MRYHGCAADLIMQRPDYYAGQISLDAHNLVAAAMQAHSAGRCFRFVWSGPERRLLTTDYDTASAVRHCQVISGVIADRCPSASLVDQDEIICCRSSAEGDACAEPPNRGRPARVFVFERRCAKAS
jgi:hypothetical protein